MTPGTLLGAALLLGGGPQEAARPVEIGAVEWMRDHAAAFERAREEEKPVAILFQEIPGCATCRRYGSGPLSHPLLVEALESELVPLLVQNNRPGADADLLKRYGEPSWNNPVMRFFAPDGTELLPRRDGVYEPAAVAELLVGALEAAGRDAPLYLEVAVAELRGAGARAVLTMHCFWEGEGWLGSQPGVLATRSGWLDGAEVVDVRFDPRLLALEGLLGKASAAGLAERVHVGERELATARAVVGQRVRLLDAEPRPAKPADRKFHLRRSHLRFVPMTPAQTARVNGALAGGRDPLEPLSPRQRALAGRVGAALSTSTGALEGLDPPGPADIPNGRGPEIPDWSSYLGALEVRLRDAVGNPD